MQTHAAARVNQSKEKHTFKANGQLQPSVSMGARGQEALQKVSGPVQQDDTHTNVTAGRSPSPSQLIPFAYDAHLHI